MKNELTFLKDYRLDNLSFGELIKRHAEDIAKIPATTLTVVLLLPGPRNETQRIS